MIYIGRELLAIKGLGRSVLQHLHQKQRQVLGELRAAMAAEVILEKLGEEEHP